MKKKHLFACGLITVLSAIIYLNSLTVPFQYDDLPGITENTDIRIVRLTWLGLRRFVVADTGSFYNPRGVVLLSFALNYYFGKYNVFGYHLVNILVHIISGIALYFFLYLTLNLVSPNYPVTSSPSHPVAQSPNHLTTQLSNYPATLTALLISLLWLTNPIQTQAVTYIVQRFTSMATMFYLLSLVFYVKGRTAFFHSHPGPLPLRERIKVRGIFYFFYFFLSLLFALCSFGSKEISISLPLVIILYEVLFFGAFKSHQLKKIISSLFLLVIFLFLIFKEIPRQMLSARVGLDLLRGFQTFPVIVHFLTLLFLPLPGRLTLDYDFVSFSPLIIIFSGLIVAGIMLITLFLIFRRKPVVPFFILWFFLNILPQSLYRAITKHELAYEHWLYLSSIGFAAVLVLTFYKIVEKTRKKIFLSFVFLLIGLQSFWTIKRNYTWKDPVTLWTDTVMKAPNNPRAHTNLGLAFFVKGELDQAISTLQNALKVSRYTGLGVSPKTYYYLGMAYQRKGWNKEAIEQLEIALEEADKGERLGAGVRFHLADLYVQEKRYEEAIKTYKKIIELDKRNETAYLHLANCYQLAGLNKEAAETYHRLLEINPKSYEAHYNLGTLYKK